MQKMRQGDWFQTFLFLEKALDEAKAKDLQLSFNTFGQPSTWHAIKTNFILLEKGLGIVSPPHLCMIFQEKCFMLYSIKL